jgi:ribonuclease HI
MPEWQQNDWKKQNRSEIKDLDLLKGVDKLCSEVKTKFILIDGERRQYEVSKSTRACVSWVNEIGSVRCYTILFVSC